MFAQPGELGLGEKNARFGGGGFFIGRRGKQAIELGARVVSVVAGGGDPGSGSRRLPRAGVNDRGDSGLFLHTELRELRDQLFDRIALGSRDVFLDRVGGELFGFVDFAFVRFRFADPIKRRRRQSDCPVCL